LPTDGKIDRQTSCTIALDKCRDRLEARLWGRFIRGLPQVPDQVAHIGRSLSAGRPDQLQRIKNVPIGGGALSRRCGERDPRESMADDVVELSGDPDPLVCNGLLQILVMAQLTILRAAAENAQGPGGACKGSRSDQGAEPRQRSHFGHGQRVHNDACEQHTHRIASPDSDCPAGGGMNQGQEAEHPVQPTVRRLPGDLDAQTSKGRARGQDGLRSLPDDREGLQGHGQDEPGGPTRVLVGGQGIGEAESEQDDGDRGVDGSDPVKHATHCGTDSLASVTFALGLIAALLTTILGFISLLLGVAALVCGGVQWRRGAVTTRLASGMTMAAVCLYVILTEMFIPDLGL
jgi:hypothetical protein